MFVSTVSNSRVRNFNSHLLVEEALQRVGGMDPTICIENVFWYILGVDTIDGVSHILPRGHDETEGDQDDDGDGVMQTEDRGVDVDVADFYQVLQATEYVQHLKATATVVRRSASGGAEPETNISTPPPPHAARDQQSNGSNDGLPAGTCDTPSTPTLSTAVSA